MGTKDIPQVTNHGKVEHQGFAKSSYIVIVRVVLELPQETCIRRHRKTNFLSQWGIDGKMHFDSGEARNYLGCNLSTQ